MERNKAIIDLYHAGFSCNVIFLKLKAMKVSLSTVKYTVKRFKETGSINYRPRPGAKWTVRTSRLIRSVRQKISRNGKRSMRKMAREAGIGRESMRKLIKEDLNMKPYHFKKRQLLNDNTKDKRLERSQSLLKCFKSASLPSIIWTDEKIFTVQMAYNSQNDRILSRNINEVPINKKSVFCRQKPASVMVWAGVTSCGRKTPLIFIPEGVKVNQHVYLAMLRDQVKPWIDSNDWPSSYIFQQDGAPSHTSNLVQKWCSTNFEGFWDKNQWPPSSPDLNVMDFSI